LPAFFCFLKDKNLDLLSDVLSGFFRCSGLQLPFYFGLIGVLNSGVLDIMCCGTVECSWG
jgi:hypothetical protein